MGRYTTSPSLSRPRLACGPVLRFSHLDASMGVSVKLTNSDTRMAKAMVMPKLERNRPGMPPRKLTGRNTATSENQDSVW
jgi:hypothetical protein